MIDLPPAKLAFRVAIFAGVLGAMAWLPPGVHGLAAFVLLLVAAAFFYEAWVVRRSRPAQRRNLLWGALSTMAAGALAGGLLAFAATPLLALAAVCGALGVVAAFGDPGSQPSE